MIDNILNQLGLSDKEKIIYKLILERGKISPALLARIAKINRTTVYSVASVLKSKGLIAEDLGGKIIYYIPTDTEGLEKTIKKEGEKFKEKERHLRELQETLKNIPKSKTYSVPKIRFIEEEDINDYLYESTPKWHESMMKTDKTWRGFQDHTFVEKFEKWIDWHWEVAPKEIDLKLFTNESKIEKNMETKKYAKKRIMKFLKSSEPAPRFENKNYLSIQSEGFSATQWVIGEYLIFVMTKQHPYYLVEINDSVLAANTRELFKILWEKIC